MKTTKNLFAGLLLILLSGVVMACSSSGTETASKGTPASQAPSQTSGKITQLSAEQFAEKIKGESVQLVDVRTAGEVATGKIPNAVNIDYNSTSFEEMAAKLDPGKPVAVYCKVGGRSARAAKVFQSLGFKEIYELEGGIISWNASGLPTEK